MTHPIYRADIDGLRAIAIIPVILFHGGISFFSGGFVGVDVFFVISGFLITNIIVRDISCKQFSFSRFYARRVGRIFPALFFMVLVTAICSFFLATPSDLEVLGQSQKAVSLFLSNYFFMGMQSEYWEQTAVASQPLLHTWSLAIEEQFYILFPGLLWLTSFISKRIFVNFIIVLVLLISFILSLYIIKENQAVAFYSLPTRLWELAIGGLVALNLNRIKNTIQSKYILEVFGVLGLFIIIFSIIVYNSTISFPNTYVLLPCTGTILIIVSGSCRLTVVRKLLSINPLVNIGKISYSLYLWHWPVFVLTSSQIWKAKGYIEVPFLMNILVIVLLALLSWFFVETPIRKKANQLKPRYVLISGLLVSLIIFEVGQLLENIGQGSSFIKQSMPEKYMQLIVDVKKVSGDSCPEIVNHFSLPEKNTKCIVGNKSLNNIDFAVIGDSHARMWTQGINQVASKYNISGLILQNSVCAPVDKVIFEKRTECLQINHNKLDFIVKSDIQYIILVAAWDLALVEKESQFQDQFINRLEKTIQQLISQGKQVIIVLDVPYLSAGQDAFDNGLASIRNNNSVIYGVTRVEYQNRKSRRILQAFVKKYNIALIDPIDTICPKDKCVVAKNGATLYRDFDHLTDTGSIIFNDVFSHTLEQIGNQVDKKRSNKNDN